MPTKQILLIDDEELMVRITQKILTREGYLVDTAENGKEALLKLAENNYHYDLIITDLLMPYANGYEIISHVKNLSGTRKIPVIIISSVGNEENILECFRIGADDYIKKPYMPGELLIRVKRLLMSD